MAAVAAHGGRADEVEVGMGWFRSSKSSRGGEGHASTFEERLAAIEPGVPGRCPSCDGLGYIDDLDLGRRYQLQHCKSCGHRWEYLFDANAHVVGVTELDDEGRPVARMRVRDRALLTEPDPAAATAPVVPPVLPPLAVSPDRDDVIDLRGDAGEADVDLRDEVVDLREPGGEGAASGPEQLSPAEWLRLSLRR
jgi:hypothetical protein